MTHTLHDYQERARDHLQQNPRAGLFMECGLGKTGTTLCALEDRHLPALVIAPKRVAEMVWSEERPLWRPDLSMAVAVEPPSVQCVGFTKSGRRCESTVVGADRCHRHGGPGSISAEEARLAALKSGADIVVISRDNIGDVPLKHGFQTVVLDELSSFKSHSSARFKVASKLTKSPEHVWGLTGTPAPNGYLDLWPEVFLLDRGQRLGNRITAYRERYFRVSNYQNGFPVSWTLRPGARERIDALLKDLCLSFLAEDYLNVPEPIFNRVLIPNPVAGIYREMKSNLAADLRLLGLDALHTAANAGVLSNRLSQITAGFLYSDNLGGAATRLHHEKTKAVREIVDGTGSPVMVFYRFTEELEALQKAIPEASTIDVPNLQRSWNAGDIPVLLAHPASIGHGLNLQKGPGHTMVFTTEPWSLEEWLQCIGRLARQGQRNRITVHSLVIPGTVDEVVSSALLTKESVQDALMRYLA